MAVKAYTKNGWTDWGWDGKYVAVEKDDKIMGLSFRVADDSAYEISWSLHGDKIGWSPWAQNGMEVSNQKLGINAVRIKFKEKQQDC